MARESYQVILNNGSYVIIEADTKEEAEEITRQIRELDDSLSEEDEEEEGKITFEVTEIINLGYKH